MQSTTRGAYLHNYRLWVRFLYKIPSELYYSLWRFILHVMRSQPSPLRHRRIFMIGPFPSIYLHPPVRLCLSFWINTPFLFIHFSSKIICSCTYYNSQVTGFFEISVTPILINIIFATHHLPSINLKMTEVFWQMASRGPENSSHCTLSLYSSKVINTSAGVRFGQCYRLHRRWG